MGRELSFWLAVALIAVAAVALTKLLAASEAGAKVPGLRPLASII